MCEYIDGSHVMPGYGCCYCRAYNGLQRKLCRCCGRERHEITIPAHVRQCHCGFGYEAGRMPVGTLAGKVLKAGPFYLCPNCNCILEEVTGA